MVLRIATRDYARQHRPKGAPARGKVAPRKAASSKTPARGSAALGLPLWAWMVVSLSVIVLAAVLYYISRPVAPMDMAPSSEAKAGKAAKTIEIPPKEPSRFTFYEMLPSYEVVVPDDVINPPKPKPGATRNNLPAEAVAATEPLPEVPAPKPSEKPTTAADVKPVIKPAPQPAAEESLAAAIAREAPPQPTSQLAKGERFLIQVAAFRTKADAEQRVAALTLAGLAARVEQVTIDSKDTWYRVRLGPYGSAAAAAEAQRSLKAQGFSGVVMKVKT
ncbi:MAG: SPOR domain-containing protein [Pseudomonadota bacterium]